MLACRWSVVTGIYNVLHVKKNFPLWYSAKISWILWNITWLILNITWLTGVLGSIKVYLNTSISKKERGTNLSETRLSEAVSTNLIQQLGSLKDFWYTLKTKVISVWALFSNSQMVLNVSGEGRFDSNLFQSWLHFN